MTTPALGDGGRRTFEALTGRPAAAPEHAHPDLAAVLAGHEDRITRLESPTADSDDDTIRRRYLQLVLRAGPRKPRGFSVASRVRFWCARLPARFSKIREVDSAKPVLTIARVCEEEQCQDDSPEEIS